LILDRGKIVLFFTASRPALGPTEFPIQWVLGALSLGDKVTMKLTTLLHALSRTRMVELYLHSPKCLHGIVLN
jgi:hypothetical protein